MSTTSRHLLSLLAGAAVLAPAAGAQQGAMPGPAIRPLGPTVATSAEGFTNVSALRGLSNGKVLVNDPQGRRVVLLDEKLALAKVVADSTPETGNAYSGRLAGLIPFRGDSSLFVDPQSLSMMVIDGEGRQGRVMSVPRPDDAFSLIGFQGMPGFDGQGRLVYRSSGLRMGGGPGNFTMMRQRTTGPGGGAPAMPTFPDSAPILRVDLATRKVDTVAKIKVPKITMEMKQDEDGRITMSSLVNPLPQVDEWAVLPNGTVAIVRGIDYHVDFVKPDGTVEKSAKLPFEWQRMSDEDKVALIDSVKAMRARMPAGGPLMAGGGDAPRMQIRMEMGPGGGPPRRGAERSAQQQAGPGAGSSPAAGRPGMEINFVPPSDLPDYKPPFFANAVRADADGNLWIRTTPTRKITGGPVYDVVNAKGELVDRVQLPADRNLVGFGPGVVYMTVREGNAFKVEAAKVK